MKTEKKIIILVAFALLAAVVALIILNKTEVKSEMMTQYKEMSIKDVPQEKWDALSKKKIFFAHMSVGNNIMDGMRDVLEQNPMITLNISNREINQAFCHVMLGSNAKPLEKIASFQSQMKQLQTPPDIAFLKFCYVDFYASTDAQQVFNAYQKMIDELQITFPDTAFMHCTVPLTTGPKSTKRKVKEVVKSLVGKTTTVDDNAKRLEFSDLLNQHYKPETIIDVALFESTTPGGKHCYKTSKGRKVPFLLKEYTTDGGHLNESGSQRVAEQMLIQLTNCVEQ